MKKAYILSLLSTLVLTSYHSYASDQTDFAYFNTQKLFKNSTSFKYVASTIQQKFSAQESQLLVLSSKIDQEESQITILSNRASSYDKLSAKDKLSYDTLYKKYTQDVDNFSNQADQFREQLGIVNKYAGAQMRKIIYSIAKDYARQNKIRVVYTSDQIVYASDDNDITDKLIPLVDKADVSTIVDNINKAKFNNQ